MVHVPSSSTDQQADRDDLSLPRAKTEQCGQCGFWLPAFSELNGARDMFCIVMPFGPLWPLLPPRQ